MGEGRIGSVYAGDGRFIRGRFIGVDPAQHTCDFPPDDPTTAGLLRAGSSYPYLDNYWGDRAELVLDEGRTWREADFQPRETTPIGGELIPGGWDHEHCSICWERIGCGGQAAGLVSGANDWDWVCGECHRLFVVPRSLEFVTWQAGFNHPSGP